MSAAIERVSGIDRGVAARIPPHAYFIVSAIFHNLGPAFAVLLFAHVEVLGVAWFRIATAALIFAVWRRPWRVLATASRRQLALILALGAVLGVMNSVFYMAIHRLPLGTVAAIEFVGPIVLAAIGARTGRNVAALIAAAVGVFVLSNAQLMLQPLGLLLAFANCALFMLYVILGHRLAADGGASGIDRLAAAMMIAFVVVCPIGFQGAVPAFGNLTLLGAAVGVGVCSSIIPYVCDQLAMSRLSRATFSLLLSLLPATAVVIGSVVLKQIPSAMDLIGVGLVIAGVALHRPRPEPTATEVSP